MLIAVICRYLTYSVRVPWCEYHQLKGCWSISAHTVPESPTHMDQGKPAHCGRMSCTDSKYLEKCTNT